MSRIRIELKRRMGRLVGPEMPHWIFKSLIILSIFLQFIFLRSYQSENDLCQHFQAFRNFKSQQPIYQLFPVRDCWQKSIHIDKQYPAYPPTTMLFLYPLSFIDLSTATIFWDIINIITYLLLLTLILLYFHQLKIPILSIILFISTFTSTFMLALYIRNFTIILAFLILLSLFVLKKNQSIAGFLIAIAALLKLWPIIFLSLGLFNKKYRQFFISGVFIFLSGLFLSIFVFGANNFYDYITKVIPFEHIFSYFPGNLSLTSAFIKSKYPVFILVFFIFYSVYYLLKSKNYPNIFFAILLTIYFVFGPLSWSTTAILLIIPLTILIQKIIFQKKPISAFKIFLITIGCTNFLFPELTIYLTYFLTSPIPSILLSTTPLLVIKPLSD